MKSISHQYLLYADPGDMYDANISRMIMEWYRGYVSENDTCPSARDFINMYEEYKRSEIIEVYSSLSTDEYTLYTEGAYGTTDANIVADRILDDQYHERMMEVSELISMMFIKMGLTIYFTDDEAGFIEEWDLSTPDPERKGCRVLGAQVPLYRTMYYDKRSHPMKRDSYEYLERK